MHYTVRKKIASLQTETKTPYIYIEQVDAALRSHAAPPTFSAHTWDYHCRVRYACHTSSAIVPCASGVPPTNK